MRTAAIILALPALSTQTSIGYTHIEEGTCSPFYRGGYICSSCPDEHFKTSDCDGLCYKMLITTAHDDGTETTTCTHRCGSKVN